MIAVNEYGPSQWVNEIMIESVLAFVLMFYDLYQRLEHQ